MLEGSRRWRDGGGAAEEEPLTKVDAGGARTLESGFIFDSLGDSANVERPSEVDDRLDHSAIGFIGRQIPDEFDVDLELGDCSFLR